MIDGRDARSVNISRNDLAVVAEAVMARFPLRAGEATRLARMRELLTCASELNRILAMHTHHALVHCQGTHGIGDLMADTNSLFDALAAYGALVSDTADAYRALAVDTHVQMRRAAQRDSTSELHAEISAS